MERHSAAQNRQSKHTQQTQHILKASDVLQESPMKLCARSNHAPPALYLQRSLGQQVASSKPQATKTTVNSTQPASHSLVTPLSASMIISLHRTLPLETEKLPLAFLPNSASRGKGQQNSLQVTHQTTLLYSKERHY